MACWYSWLFAVGILHYFLAQIHLWICCSFSQIPVSAIMALGSQCRGFSTRDRTERNLILFQRDLCAGCRDANTDQSRHL